MTKTNQENNNKNKTISKNGSVLILALIMASILLSVGMGISNIALKEIKLSSIGNESGKAFYMADTGAECALYWDLRSTTTVDMVDNNTLDGSQLYVFATSTDAYWSIPTNIKCFNGINIATSWNLTTNPARSLGKAVTTFTLSDSDLTKPCAIVEVTKNTVAGVITTTIDSRGRSSCDTNPRRVERGLKVSY